MAGALILLVFLVFGGLMYTRAMPALLAVPLMAIVMSLVAGVPLPAIGAVVVTGASALAPVYVAVIFGAMLGRVTLDSGIARAIVSAAAEFSGESPAVVTLVMCAIVALLFVSLSGLGAIIMVGTIVLPIMMTTGVPRNIASTAFLMAFALGFIFNIVNWKFYTKYFGVTGPALMHYAVVLAAIDVLALVLYVTLSFRGARGYATWADRKSEASPRVPFYALVTPLLPIVLYFFLHLDPVVAFALSAVYGVLTTRPAAAVQTLVAAAIRGVEDIAPAIVLFVGIGMLLTATKQPQFAAALGPLVNAHALQTPVVFVAIFGLLSPLALYRGPLNPFGVGIAVFSVLLSAHVFPAVVLVAAVMAVVQVQNVCDPTNTANVWVANYTGVPIAEITRRTLPYQVAVATAACVAVVLLPVQLFHLSPFRNAIASASAATLAPPGMFVGRAGRGRIAVGDDGSADARAVVPLVVRLLNVPPARAFAHDGHPNASTCTNKQYAAAVTVSSSRFTLLEGTDVDVGIDLSDCGGWEVTQWHDHMVVAEPSQAVLDSLAEQGVARMEHWARHHRRRWMNLLEQGLAYAPGDPPSYYYSLFKTVDGNMRAYVRAGGPAYDAGLRSNDIVERLDGKFWWEYGTFATQARAYDGKPHLFEIERDGRKIEVQLGEPFTT